MPREGFKVFTAVAKRTVNAFEDAALTNWDNKSRVDYNDQITLLKEQGNAYQVEYPTPSGKKIKWVTKDILKEIPAGEYIFPVDSRKLTTLYYYSGGGKHACHWMSPKPMGIDIGSCKDYTVKAIAGGTVLQAKWSTTSNFGYYVEIDHGQGRRSWYAHMRDKPLVSAGQTVSQGQALGYVGGTGGGGEGKAPGFKKFDEHLHFEMNWAHPYEFFQQQGINFNVVAANKVWKG